MKKQGEKGQKEQEWEIPNKLLMLIRNITHKCIRSAAGGKDAQQPAAWLRLLLAYGHIGFAFFLLSLGKTQISLVLPSPAGVPVRRRAAGLVTLGRLPDTQCGRALRAACAAR